MSLAVTVRGVAYTIPEDQDEDYGVYGTQFLNALATYVNVSLFVEAGRIARIDRDTSNAAVNQTLLYGSDGDGTNGDNSAGFRTENGQLQYKERGGNWGDLEDVTSANTALDNLLTVAINTSLISDTDETDDLGSDAIEWNDVWTYEIKHNDAVTPDFTLSTTGNDGDIYITPNGTGRVILDTTIEVETGLIEETVGNLEITATGAGSDVTIDSDTGDVIFDAGSDSYTIDKSGNTLEIVGSAEIQDYTVVGSVGDALQQYAGHTLAVADFPTAADVVALYNLNDNTDLSGNTNTLSDGDAYNAGTGILGVATTAHLGAANEHLLASAITGMTAGGDVDLTIGGWHKTAAVSAGLLAVGVAAATKIQYYTDANGYLVFDVAGNTGTSSTFFNDGNLHFVALVYDATASMAYGYVDGRTECNITATTNLNISATPELFVNAKTDGTLDLVNTVSDECFLYDDTLTNVEIQRLYATSIALPAVLQSVDCSIDAFMKPAVAGNVSKVWCDEVQRDATRVLISGGTRRSTDYYKLTGRK